MASPCSVPLLGRAVFAAAGLLCVGLGALGVIVPGLPSTVFFIAAAACFARSSPRLERWVLGLPGVGPMVRDHRAGLGMPRRAKVIAVSMMWVFSLVGVATIATMAFDVAVVVAALVGTWYVAWRVPTRERVLVARDAQRAAD